MTKAILLLVLCQLVYLIPAYLSHDPNFVHVAVPVSNQAEMNSNSISLKVEIQNNLTSSSIKWVNSYIKSGGMQNSFYLLDSKEKASFLVTTKGKGKGSFTDLSPEEEQNTTSGVVTLKISGKSDSLTLFWEVSSNLEIPNTIGYYWGNQNSNANLYELILNEQLSNSFVKKSYETWTEVNLVGDIKMAFFISDQKEAQATILLWEEKTFLPEGYYTITWDAGLGKELCLEYPKNQGNNIAWGYCIPNELNQQWVIHRNATNWYSIRSNYRKEYLLFTNYNVFNATIPTEVFFGDVHPTTNSVTLDNFKFSLEKEDGRWRIFNLVRPSYFWTGDLKLDQKYGSPTDGAHPLGYTVLFRQRSDSFSTQLFNFNLLKFTGNI